MSEKTEGIYRSLFVLWGHHKPNSKIRQKYYQEENYKP